MQVIEMIVEHLQEEKDINARLTELEGTYSASGCSDNDRIADSIERKKRFNAMLAKDGLANTLLYRRREGIKRA